MPELKHHGIKGQQWGVKHGPPYPIEKGAGVTIKKGTHLKRISSRDESKAEGHAYVTYKNEDNERYQGFFAFQLKAKRLVDKNAKVYVHDIVAKEELRSPSQKVRIETFIQMYKEDPVSMGKELAKYHKKQEWHGKAYLPQFVYNKQYTQLHGKDLKEVGYKTFVKAIGGLEPMRSKYFNELKKKGYNFIRDDQDSGVQGIEPSIILDRAKSTEYKGKRELTSKEIYSNLKKHGWYLDNERRHKEWES